MKRSGGQLKSSDKKKRDDEPPSYSEEPPVATSGDVGVDGGNGPPQAGQMQMLKPIKERQFTATIRRRRVIDINECTTNVLCLAPETLNQYINCGVIDAQQDAALTYLYSSGTFGSHSVHKMCVTLSDFVPYNEYVTGGIEAVSGNTAPKVYIGSDYQGLVKEVTFSSVAVGANLQSPYAIGPITQEEMFGQCSKIVKMGSDETWTKEIYPIRFKGHRIPTTSLGGTYPASCTTTDYAVQQYIVANEDHSVNNGTHYLWLDPGIGTTTVNTGRLTMETELVVTFYMNTRIGGFASPTFTRDTIGQNPSVVALIGPAAQQTIGWYPVTSRPSTTTPATYTPQVRRFDSR